MPRPMTKRQDLAPGEESSVNLTFKSIRNPPLDIVLSGQPISMSVLNLKHAVSDKAKIPVDKIRLLYKKKPCSDVKTVRDLMPAGERELEFSVMVVGGASSSAAPEGTNAGLMEERVGTPKPQELEGKNLLGTEEFWSDLKEFLEQRLKDKGEGDNVLRIFRNAWVEQGSA